MGRTALSGMAAATTLFVALGARTGLRVGPARDGWELPGFSAQSPTTVPVSRDGLAGSVWVANFMFTRCSGPCPLLTAEMAALDRELPRAIRLVTFTVDPGHDTLDVLGRYAARVGASERWSFARLEAGPLYTLVYEGFKLPVAYDRRAPQSSRVIHSAKFALVDRRGRVRGLYSRQGGPSLKRLRADARRLLREDA